MTKQEMIDKLPELLLLPQETEWVEFKHNNFKPQDIGEYISALSNSACLHKKDNGYLVFGIEDRTKKVLGTNFKPVNEKVGNEELENWLCHLIEPRIDFKIHTFIYEEKPIVTFSIDAAHERPVKFNGIAYIRVGTYKKNCLNIPKKSEKYGTGPLLIRLSRE